ncbi:MAG TPA: globin domain-containing protein [Polyangia bacterium]
MTPAQMHLIRRSFSMVNPIAPQAAALFYSRLFEIDPGLRALFPGDLKVQGNRLIEALARCVEAIDEPEALLASARELGERHAGLGAREAHHESVAIAMMWTLQAALGPAFSPAVREAWAIFYRSLASAAKASARAVISREPTRVCAAPASR